MMKLHDKVYDVLKWVVMIVLPALNVLYSALSGVWNWPLATEITTTISSVTVFLGAVLGISTAQYKKQI